MTCESRTLKGNGLHLPLNLWLFMFFMFAHWRSVGLWQVLNDFGLKKWLWRAYFPSTVVPMLLGNIRINMHNWCTHKIPDWHFNVSIICWGRDSSHVQLILLTCVLSTNVKTRRKSWRGRKQNHGKCLINKWKIVSALRLFRWRNSNYYVENQPLIHCVSNLNRLFVTLSNF